MSDPRRKRGMAIFPPRPSHISVEDAEAEARARGKPTPSNVHPIPCQGRHPRCRLHIASVTNGTLIIRGPRERGGDEDEFRFRFTGDPIPGTDMHLVLAAIPIRTNIEIRCSCGHENVLRVKALQALAMSLPNG